MSNERKALENYEFFLNYYYCNDCKTAWAIDYHGHKIVVEPEEDRFWRGPTAFQLAWDFAMKGKLRCVICEGKFGQDDFSVDEKMLPAHNKCLKKKLMEQKPNL